MNQPVTFVSSKSDTFELLKTAYVQNRKLPLVNRYPGQLTPPAGWKIARDSKLVFCELTYQVKSLVAAKIPYISDDMSQIEIDRITSEYFWQSSQFRLELFVSNSNGDSWALRNVLPIKRPDGYPIQTINLLSSLNGVPRALPEGARIACAFRDVGYGVPQFGQDTFTIDYEIQTTETMYPFVAYSNQMQITQYSTQVTGNAPNMYKLLVPTRASRKSATVTFSSSTTTATGTLRYGGVNESTAASQPLSNNVATAIAANYGGELSFTGTGAQFSTNVTIVEILG